MKNDLLEKYYNKFDENHRLTTRHGQVEFETSMKFIHEIIGERKNLKILDVGAGTGRYSIELCHEGHDVTAVELVKRNLEVLRSKHEKIKTWQGNALDLHFLDDSVFDITIMFGPMYHLHSEEERICAFNEAKRVTKKGGFIFAAYIMNEYAVIQYCFGKDKVQECLENGSLTSDFHCVTKSDDLYSYLRLEDIDSLNEKTGLKKIKRFAQDGASDYIRRELNAMSEETFCLFKKYHLSTCERPELFGASSHIADILLND